MCYCCFPPAITALLCLWVRSGFSKASVAGALTFFPPNPAFYKFERYRPNGEKIPDDEEEDDDEEEQNETKEDDASENLNNHQGEESPPSSRAQESLSGRTKKLQQQAAQKLQRDERDARDGVIYKIIPDPRIPKVKYDGVIKSIKIYNAKVKSYIATVIYHNASNTRTLIYSHGNATDIGAMSYVQGILAKNLSINIIMYDYSGYGESGGIPLEPNTYQDIETVYNYAVTTIANGNPSRIIIYGQSVGSGPSCYLCMNKQVGGLILHSPFMSGMRVLTPSRALACLDIYPNIDRIKHVKVPVMIIHGLQDEEVDASHGHALYNAVPAQYRAEPWWVSDRGHNDICEGKGRMTEYVKRLRNYLASLEDLSDDSQTSLVGQQRGGGIGSFASC